MKLNENAKKKLHLIYGISLSVLLAVVGVLFIVSCYNIYDSGAQPFTRESIGEAFGKIAVPVYVTILAIVGGMVINLVFPLEEKKLKGTRSSAATLQSFAKRVDVTSLDEPMREGIEKERRLRRILLIINTILFVLSGTLPLIYLLNPANFPAESGHYNSEILHGMLFYAISLLPLFIFEITYVIVHDASCVREIAILREAIKLNGISDGTEDECKSILTRLSYFFKKNERPITLGIRIAFVGCGVLFIVLGILNGGMEEVLLKAINICTECIGLG